MYTSGLAGTQTSWAQLSKTESFVARLNQWRQYHHNKRRIVASLFPSLTGGDASSLQAQDMAIAAVERGAPAISLALLEAPIPSGIDNLTRLGDPVAIMFEGERHDVDAWGGWLESPHDELGNPVIFLDTSRLIVRFGQRGGRAGLFQAMALGLGSVRALRALGIAEEI